LGSNINDEPAAGLVGGGVDTGASGTSGAMGRVLGVLDKQGMVKNLSTEG
jgi:hypothetical protein